ncbi:hypothetical protein [Acinetobacter sp.]|uniref:hypothetical protein n=1 Tax=Acinetobacter sp. TaxID=472 RepID=UPI003752AD4D
MSEGFIQTGMNFATFLANAAEVIELSHPDEQIDYEAELHKILAHIIPNTSTFIVENALQQYIDEQGTEETTVVKET